jgi:hypothetical protein
MNAIKLSVTIVLPGSTMMTSQECDENPQENYKKNCILLSVKRYDNKTKKSYYVTERLDFKTRKCIPAQQVIRMTDEAYDYMTSSACPEWYAFAINKWRKMSKIERLEEHLDRLCKSLGGLSYTYVIFKD